MLHSLLYCIGIVITKILVNYDTLQYGYCNTFVNSFFSLVLYGDSHFTHVNVLFNANFIIMRRYKSYYLCSVALCVRLNHDAHMNCIITLSTYINIIYIIYYIKLHILYLFTNFIKFLTNIANFLYLQLIYCLVLTLNKYLSLGTQWLDTVFVICFCYPLYSYHNWLFSCKCNGY